MAAMRSAKAQTSSDVQASSRCGEPPWQIDFVPEPRALPEEVDIAILGAGFTGLAAAGVAAARGAGENGGGAGS